MAPYERIDPEVFRRKMRKIWDVKHGRSSALAIVTTLESMRDTMARIRYAVGIGVWPADTSSVAASLRGWDRSFEAFSRRLGIYRDEIPPCWGPTGDCWTGDGPSDTEERYLVRYVVGPILEGKFPDADPSLGLHWPGRAEALNAAGLWNQLIEVEALWEEQIAGGYEVAVLGEWLTAVQRQLAEAAPGEEPTIRDRIVAAVAGLVDAAKKAGREAAETIGKVAAIGGAGLIGLWVLRSYRKNSKTRTTT